MATAGKVAIALIAAAAAGGFGYKVVLDSEKSQRVADWQSKRQQCAEDVPFYEELVTRKPRPQEWIEDEVRRGASGLWCKRTEQQLKADGLIK